MPPPLTALLYISSALTDCQLEGCNLVENSTLPDQTVNNFNPTRQEPDYFEPDPTGRVGFGSGCRALSVNATDR